MKQNVTQTDIATSDSDIPAVTLAQDYYVTFVASAGLSVEDDGTIKTITSEQFALKLGVTRVTLWRWKNSIPNFEQLVAKRRREIFTLNRENLVWKGLFLRAAKGDHKQAEMILSHFSDYTPPTQKHEVKIGGLADLVKMARSKNAQIKAIDVTPTNGQ